ncbi:MAG: DUF4173 domain-containing protein [Ruminococcus sp.]|nr:DUF4173 domain-containing protein [Ruminococcus sp.]
MNKNDIPDCGVTTGAFFDPPCYVVPPKEEIQFSRSEHIMAFCTALLAFFFVHFVLWNTSGFFTTLFYFTVITMTMIFTAKSGFTLNGFHKLSAVILYIFSLVFSLTSNSLIKNLDAVFLFVGGAYFVYSVCTQRKDFGRFLPFQLAKCIFEYPFSHISKEYTAINSTLKSSERGKSIKYSVLGLVIALPLTYVVGLLLMSADSGVEKILNTLGGFIKAQNIWTILIEIGLSIPAGGYLFGMLYSNTHKEKVKELDEDSCEAACKSCGRINSTMIYASVTPVCILYAVFFISQTGYLLSAFAGKLPGAYSYSEYARKGFFELFALTVINIGIIAFINLFTKRNGGEKPLGLRLYTSAICIFTLVITASAVSKMIMYVDNYGLTRKRIYTTWFMLLTAVIFIFLIVKQFRKSFRFTSAGCAAFTAMFALLCFSRPDALIARYNLEYCAYRLSYNDIVEMSELSDDAAAVLMEEKYDAVLESIFERYNQIRYGSEQLREDIMGDDYTDSFTPETVYGFRQHILEKLDHDPYNGFNISALMIRANGEPK